MVAAIKIFSLSAAGEKFSRVFADESERDTVNLLTPDNIGDFQRSYAFQFFDVNWMRKIGADADFAHDKCRNLSPYYTLISSLDDILSRDEVMTSKACDRAKMLKTLRTKKGALGIIRTRTGICEPLQMTSKILRIVQTGTGVKLDEVFSIRSAQVPKQAELLAQLIELRKGSIAVHTPLMPIA